MRFRVGAIWIGALIACAGLASAQPQHATRGDAGDERDLAASPPIRPSPPSLVGAPDGAAMDKSASCELPFPYCVGQPSSLGCETKLLWHGQASVSAGSGFWLIASGLLPHATAIFLYSTFGPASIPFHGGTLCLAGPHRRLPPTVASSIGACNDAQFDFNTWIASGVDPLLVPGQYVWAQCWSRDGGSASGTVLTKALRFRLCL